MRRAAKTKADIRRTVAARKTVLSASAAARRSFPAWIDAAGSTAPFTMTRTATPRVRDGLVLRTVNKKKTAERSVPHGPGAR